MCHRMFEAYGVAIPALTEIVLGLPLWLPVLVGLGGAVVIIAKERRLTPRWSVAVNGAALVASVLLSLVLLMSLLMPVYRVMESLAS